MNTILGQMRCPNCGTLRRTDTSKCICGYNPLTGKIEENNIYKTFKNKMQKLINTSNDNQYIKKVDTNLNTSILHPFEEITQKMFKTYLKKNKDYGNSFDQSLDKWGLSVSAIRLGDKLNRFESFVKNGSFAVDDEGVRDTLMDLASYSIMTVMYLDSKINEKDS